MKLPESYYNRTSYIGTIIAAISLLLMLFVFIIATFFMAGGNYIGLLLYMVLPGLLVSGLLLIPIGMFFRRRRISSGEEIISHRVVIDLNNYKHRNAALVFGVGTLIFLILTSIGSYEAFHYTESNQFCGTLCHQVMDPEYVTYQTSAHARVKCVECHVGPGADFYAKSKLSGLYQVYAVLFNKYPRPIPTPISSLRPARETCEQCHWPEKFYPNRIRNERHYLADSANTQWDIIYRMKIGSSHSSQGISEGIHWHINSKVKIEYIESTSDREIIPWVKYINLESGDTLIYQNTEEPLDEETIMASTPRTMDCIDCHNRPSHKYLAPQDYIDHAIAKGEISSDLPEIKTIAMQVLGEHFTSLDTALMNIKAKVNEFYNENYPELVEAKQELINHSIEGISSAFSHNEFPEMGANWDKYPNHIGHMEYNGCFRCHDNMHVADNGKTISRDCNLCHTILQQGTKDNMMAVAFSDSLEFKHPVDIDEAWKEYACTECHRQLFW
ncbi:MAG: NapC/NirT family cytochrome c [Bacteroidales bacterium]|nr:NapC/NirT family cytochrome c [Bacteroidales bacterium]MCF8457052.1 NapC/NirT family cytochrome c [Bacteroidales bacterium]